MYSTIRPVYNIRYTMAQQCYNVTGNARSMFNEKLSSCGWEKSFAPETGVCLDNTPSMYKLKLCPLYTQAA